VVDAFPRLILRTESERKEAKDTTLFAANSKRSKPDPTDGGFISDDEGGQTSVKNEGSRALKKSQIFHKFSFEDIRGLNQKHARGGQPCLKFPGAIEEMQRLSVDRWCVPVHDLMQKTSNLVIQHLRKNVFEVFGSYEKFPLYQVVFEHVIKEFQTVFDAQQSLLNDMCDVERLVPYTLDGVSLKKKSRKIQSELYEKRLENRIGLERMVHDAAQSVAEARGKKKEKFSVTKDDLPDDEYDTELEMLAVSILPYSRGSDINLNRRMFALTTRSPVLVSLIMSARTSMPNYLQSVANASVSN
jgi:hypothetical protein